MRLVGLNGTLTLFAAAQLLVGCSASPNTAVGSGSGGTTSPPVTSPPALSISTSTLPSTLVGSSYSAQLTEINGTGPFTWTSTAIPSGLTLSKSGLLSGTPTATACGVSIPVTVTDSSTPVQTSTASIKFTAAGFYVGLQPGQVAVFYNYVIDFQCGANPVAWSLVSGSLPPGLQMVPFPGAEDQLNIQGTPTQPGIFNFTVQSKDATGLTALKSFSLNIMPPVLVITDSLMQLGTLSRPFDHPLATAGGTPPYSFTISTGALAPGLQVNGGTGEITGTPAKAGLYQFNIKVTDVTSPSVYTFEKPYTLLVVPAALPKRNNSFTTATPVFPGTYIASLSPYTDAAGNAAPDHDYYSLTVNGGDKYDIGAGAEYSRRLSASNSAPVYDSADPAIEILDSTGARLKTCNDPVVERAASSAPFAKGTGNFTDPCVDHGGDGTVGASYLTVTVGPGLNQTIYIHVFDFQGRARPDFIYTLSITKD